MRGFFSRQPTLKANHRRPWDLEAVEELRRLANDGLTAREIARKIGRSEDGTRLRLRLEGLVSPRASRWADW